MKRVFIFAITCLLVIGMSITCLAGTWKQDEKGYWYVNDDGTYPTNTWMTIDGKEYYFNADGYLLVNTITPDGFTVDSNGEKCSAANSIGNTSATVNVKQNTGGSSVTRTNAGTQSTTSTGGVWITNTGEKYHSKPNCGQTKNARQATVQEAKNLGLEPCKKCY